MNLGQKNPPTKKARFVRVCSEDNEILNSGHTARLGEKLYNCEGFIFTENQAVELNMELID